jgi:hypothetical protein
MTAVYLASEDALAEAIADRLIEEENEGMRVAVHVGRKGNGYLRKNLPIFIKISHTIPVVLFTDLDRCACPAGLINDWLGNIVLPQTMLFRVAVHEAEAWLLADREGFAQFSGVPLHRIPDHPEALGDPKEVLLNLVRRYGKRTIKADILPEKGSTARVGLAYNQALCTFVQQLWSPHRAGEGAESLKRTRHRIHELRLNQERR